MNTKKIHSWLMKVVRQREYLITNGYSRQNLQLVAMNTAHIRKYLEIYTYRDPEKMHRFIHRNMDRILSIIPGAGSSCHETRLREFNEILTWLQSHPSIKTNIYENSCTY